MITIAPKVHMPKIGLGTFRISGDQVHLALDRALKIGYRFFDTAQYYENEKEIGDSFKKLLPKYNLQRTDVFITTKLRHNIPGQTEKSLDESLARLQLDYVDLFLIHYPSPMAARGNPPGTKEENMKVRLAIWAEMENLLETGKVRAIGVSNYEIDHLTEILEHGRLLPALNQCEFHPHMQKKSLLAFCQQHNVHFQSFTSLARCDPRLHQQEPLMLELAEKYKTTTSQICLAWALKKNVSVVPKSIDEKRLENNFAAQNLELTDEDVAKIDQLDKNQPYTSCAPWLVP